VVTGCGQPANSSNPQGVNGSLGATLASFPTLVTVSRLGPVQLGESKADVTRELGGGTAAPGGSGGLVVIRYSDVGLSVTYQHDRAFLIDSDSSKYRTKAGIGVGSALKDVRAQPHADCMGIGGGAFDCKVGAHDSQTPPLIDLQGENGQVGHVEVQSASV
jgi:hypothetical protein